MSLELTRQKIVTAVEALRASYPIQPLVVEYDNRLSVDIANQTAPYLIAEVVFITSIQADLSDHPRQRVYGQLLLTASSKDGSGSAKALTIIEHFSRGLQRNTYSGVRMGISTFIKPKEHLGQWLVSAIVPFWFDRTL